MKTIAAAITTKAGWAPMKKLFCIALAASMLFTSGAALAVNATPSQAYQVVVPLEYSKIAGIWDNWFITEENTGYSMYKFDGTRVDSDVLNKADSVWVSFGYLVVETITDPGTSNHVDGVYTKDFDVVVPPIYNFISILSGTQCVGMNVTRETDSYVAGPQYLIDLTTGKVIRELGMRAPGNDYLMGDEPDNGLTFTATDVLDIEGQVLLDFSPYLVAGQNNPSAFLYDSVGDLIYVSYNYQWYIFTGRGRLVSQVPPIASLNHGLYIEVTSTDGYQDYIIDREGRTVIPLGTFDSYTYNRDGATYSSNDDYVIVSKGGKYGIIELPNITLPTSAWAAEDVAAAEEKGLTPDEVKMWWKDRCTREEFCEMLALTVKTVTGKSLTDLADGKRAANFTDCDHPDVLAASALGIVNGVGGGKFEPSFFLTREQAASALARTAQVLGIQPSGGGVPFADAGGISGWARADVAAVSRILCGDARTPLMRGVTANCFSPQGFCTVEQAATAMLRLTETNAAAMT